MERSGLSVRGVTDKDLVSLSRAVGPFLSVYLTTEQKVENAAQRSGLHWEPLRRRLASVGAPEHLLGRVDDLVPDAHLEGSALGMVVAADGESVLDYHRQPVARDIGRFAAAPSLGPLLAWRQERPSYVLVLADKAGADVVAVSGDEPPERVEAGGETFRISKSRGGGWAHRRMLNRVEETWGRNSRQVAEELDAAIARTGARLVLVSGDPHAVSILESMLPRETAEMTKLLSSGGGRAADGGADQLGEEISRLVASLVAEDTVAAIEQFRQERGEGRRAADGPAAVFDALRMAQVDVLLVHDDSADDDVEQAYFSPEDPTICALSPDELAGLPTGSLERARSTDVAVRAALVSGAAVRLVPFHGGPEGGLGAILRWSGE